MGEIQRVSLPRVSPAAGRLDALTHLHHQRLDALTFNRGKPAPVETPEGGFGLRQCFGVAARTEKGDGFHGLAIQLLSLGKKRLLGFDQRRALLAVNTVEVLPVGEDAPNGDAGETDNFQPRVPGAIGVISP